MWWSLAVAGLFASLCLRGGDAARDTLIAPDFRLLQNASHNPLENHKSGGTRKDGDNPRDHPLVKKLIKLQKASPDHIINIDETFAHDFILAPERPYTFILVTSADKNLCPYCGELRKHLAQSVPHLMNSDGTPIVDEFGVPVFVLELMANKHRGLAKFFDIQGVPSVSLLTPHNLKCVNSHNAKASKDFDMCRIDDQNVLGLRTALHDSSELVNNFHKALGRSDISEALNKGVYHRRLAYVGASILILGTIMLYFFEWIRYQLIRHPQIIASLSLITFFVSTSGLIYNLQHNMELFGFNWQKKQSVWVAPQARQQYIAEGLFFSGACVLGSVAFFLGARLPKLLARRSPYWQDKRMWINGAVMILMLLGVGAYKLTQLGVQIKRLSADMSFFPQGMTRGPVRVDRMYAF
eukprot:Gregarina_sp_Pseudo_9__932@NODE_1598_length_1465_cov_18_295231_g1482_i0_p1_GENE_NODE_1598_length_1465_cov_18_295231_g1482_i0NODE_1598_length_1465_cov_18_295231_g1482_i0_p1_ORF_typecomplete_len410_score99_60OST3_OST6/PF04756_13/7_7e28DUF2157/PF09925_9/0_013MFS_1/PF07690_16/0_015Mem_trans/PF03547_18/0_054DUF3464/PF11947_8/0_15DUF3464/PF11947_8/2_1e03NnrU/PF07298_11/1_2NnrU/PF07298_11/1_1e02_NODE_1598_length_1465_cov_18_295231_g1482_i0451274